jgi:hypothetical protein
MLACRQSGVYLFKFHLLEAVEGLCHALYSRLGGYSPAPCDSLNLGYTESDTKENVRANRELAAACLAGGKPLSTVRQVHGTTVISVKRIDAGKRPRRWLADTRADAVITDMPGLFLTIQVADCQAVLLYDPVRAVAANVHSGWRGSIQNMAGKTVDKMKIGFGCNPKDIRAGISPSLGPCCAEFVNYEKEIPEAFWGYKDRDHRFDFWEITREQLKRAGLADTHIETARICTRCNPHLFFSFRRDRNTGRFAAAIGLAEKHANQSPGV